MIMAADGVPGATPPKRENEKVMLLKVAKLISKFAATYLASFTWLSKLQLQNYASLGELLLLYWAPKFQLICRDSWSIA